MRKRNYAAEYARRIARAKEKGYSKAVARGHAPKGTIGIKRAKLLKVQPGFVLKPVIEGQKGPGFRASPKSRAENLKRIGLDNFVPPTKLKERNKTVRKLKRKRPTEQAAYHEYLAVERNKTTLEEFVKLLKEAEFTEREAYTLWFS